MFQICQCIFKPVTFTNYENNLDLKSKRKLLLELSFYSFIISVFIVLTIRTISFYLLKIPFTWFSIIIVALGIISGIFYGVRLGIAIGIAVGISFGIFWGTFEDINVGIGLGISLGVGFGTALGIYETTKGNTNASESLGNFPIFIAVCSCLCALGSAILVITLGIIRGSNESITLAIEEINMGISKGLAAGFAGGIGFSIVYSRIFYMFPHLIQYFRAKYSNENSFELFKKSPIYWDEAIIYPLPFLTDFLLILIEANQDQGISETEFVSDKRPFQRKAAFNACLQMIILNLSNYKSINDISNASKDILVLYSFEGVLSKEINKKLKTLEDLSTSAKRYLNTSTHFNQIQSLYELEEKIVDFKKSLELTKKFQYYKFLSIKKSPNEEFLLITEKWLEIITQEKKQFRRQDILSFKEIPNPYIFGNPVNADKSSRLFVGREDIVKLIKSNLSSNISQKPALFLYGRRRIGKSSILVNLHKLLEEEYIPVYIDFQDPKYGESQPSFCYHLSKTILDALNNVELLEFTGEYPNIDSFQNNPFTTLGYWLDKAEEFLKDGKHIVLICIDEYEKIEECIQKGFLTISVLNQLRNIIQHRKYFILLISGSNELRELKLNWADYLINTKMIKISYLSKDDTRILITNPIDSFTLNYKGGIYGDAVNRIIYLTNCQPYLTQAICFELVNYLNSQNRKEASIEDVNLAADKVLVSANVYFDYIWNEECTDKEKDFLNQIIESKYKEGYNAEIRSLLRKEIIEEINSEYKFKIELMKKWIEKNAT